VQASSHWKFPVAALSLLVVSTLAACTQRSPGAAVTVPGKGIFPESITSAPDGSVYIGSIGKHSIYRAAPGASQAGPFVPPDTGGLHEVLGVMADANSGTLWACSDPGPPPAPGAVATLIAFDLATGAVKASYPLPTPGGLCNDIALGADGNAYVTDTNNMEVLRLAPGAPQLMHWAGAGEFGDQAALLDGIAVLGDRVLVATFGTGRLFAIPVQADGSAGAVAEVKLDRALDRPDGMRAFGSHALLVAESGAGRLARVDVDGESGHATTLREGFGGGIVSVTLVGEQALVIEGQFAMAGASRLKRFLRERDYSAWAVPVGKP
jgi:sugar lactone lactonase YvrE